MLDLRLNILNNYAKKFIITEATYTHNGSKKKLNFDIGKFKKFKDKIVYIVVEDQPKNILDFKADETEDQKGSKIYFKWNGQRLLSKRKSN